MMPVAREALLLAITATLLLLGGCQNQPSNSEYGPYLTKADVDADEVGREYERGVVSGAPCGAIEWREPILVADWRWRRLTLSNGDWVISGLLRATWESTDATLARANEMVESCVRRSTRSWKFEKLDLGPSAVGYRSQQTGSDEPHVITRIYSKLDLERLVMVQVSRQGPGQPTLDAEELLPTATKRASDYLQESDRENALDSR